MYLQVPSLVFGFWSVKLPHRWPWPESWERMRVVRSTGPGVTNNLFVCNKYFVSTLGYSLFKSMCICMCKGCEGSVLIYFFNLNRSREHRFWYSKLTPKTQKLARTLSDTPTHLQKNLAGYAAKFMPAAALWGISQRSTLRLPIYTLWWPGRLVRWYTRQVSCFNVLDWYALPSPRVSRNLETLSPEVMTKTQSHSMPHVCVTSVRSRERLYQAFCPERTTLFVLRLCGNENIFLITVFCKILYGTH